MVFWRTCSSSFSKIHEMMYCQRVLYLFRFYFQNSSDLSKCLCANFRCTSLGFFFSGGVLWGMMMQCSSPFIVRSVTCCFQVVLLASLSPSLLLIWERVVKSCNSASVRVWIIVIPWTFHLRIIKPTVLTRMFMDFMVCCVKLPMVDSFIMIPDAICQHIFLHCFV